MPRQSVPHAEVLIGHVTRDSGATVSGAQIAVTMGRARLTKMSLSDGKGRWSITFADGAGDFLVHVAAAGMTTVRKRVSRGMPGMPAVGSIDSVFEVDVQLEHTAAQQLAAVRVEATRPKPERRDGAFGLPQPGEGASERTVVGVAGALLPQESGDLVARGLTTPGALADADGLSVLGLSAVQTTATLGGLAFTGGSLPRDAGTTTRVTTSTYDPARGWFGGAQVAVELRPGDLFALRRGHVTGDIPQLQATDATGVRLGQRVTNLDVSFGGDGAWHDDAAVYNYGIEVARRTQNAPSLLDAGADALRATGVSPDSAARLIRLLEVAGIPTAGARSQRQTDNASFVLRLDRPLTDFKRYEPTKVTYGVTAFGTVGRTDALRVSPTTTPGAGGYSLSTGGGFQGVYSAYLGPMDWLVDVRSGVSMSDERISPYLSLPSGRVLVASNVTGNAEETGITQSLVFGGNGALQSHRRSVLWESQAELRLYPPGRVKHRLTLTTDVRLDVARNDVARDPYGTYTFSSLTDLANNAPASYSRAVDSSDQLAKVWNGFIAMSDSYRITEHLQVLYGLRLEGNKFLTVPALNAALGEVLGVRNDIVPNTVGVSPRVGFTWTPKPGRDGHAFSELGSAPVMTSSIVRGGVGEFRTLMGAEIVGPATAATGIAGSGGQLFCAGSAVPAVLWQDGTPPSACMMGGGLSVSDAAPVVRAVDPGFTAPHSWRTNLSWSSARWGISYTLEGIASLNLNQTGVINANFSGLSRFVLPMENRMIFAEAATIVPSSGIVDPSEARRARAFGSVFVQVADLRSISRQLTFALAPSNPPAGKWILSGAYTIAQSTQRQRGFDGSTFDDPRTQSWGRGDFDVRHRFLVQAGYQVGGFAFTALAHMNSGRPFTPLIGGDINGDGLMNDRAFALNPVSLTSTADQVLARDLRSLNGTVPAAIRECISNARGKAFERNACDGPWTASVNARLDISPEGHRLYHRATIGLAFQNVLGGVDQLLHGNELKGWGAPAYPDPVLYQIRGFDPASLKFFYQVNPRFGDTRPAATAFRLPFRVTLDVRLDLSRPIAEQQLDQFLKPGRAGRPGPKLTAEDLKRRYSRNVPNPYRGILEESDSLLLTRGQHDTLAVLEKRYLAKMDRVWTQLVDYLANLADNFSGSAALARQEDTLDAAWELTRIDLHETLPNVLSSAQLQILPWPAGMLYRQNQKEKVRVFM